MNQSFVIRFFLSAPHEPLDSRGAPHRTNADTKDFFSFLKRRSSPSSSSSICFPLDKRWKGNETNRFSDLELESLCTHSIKKGFFFYISCPRLCLLTTLKRLTETRDTMSTWPFRLRLSFKLTRTTSVPTIEAAAQPSCSSSSSFCALLVNCSHSPPHSATY